MPILKIYRDTRARGTCRSCGASIEWAELTSGKRHPFDAVVVDNVQESLIGGRLVEEVDSSCSHFVSCPQAADWKRK